MKQNQWQCFGVEEGFFAKVAILGVVSQCKASI
jgi:hypothetical protein